MSCFSSKLLLTSYYWSASLQIITDGILRSKDCVQCKNEEQLGMDWVGLTS